MQVSNEIKRTVWQNLYRLVQPYRKKLLWVFLIGLRSTGVALLEPLIYREAVNDIAGLFVQKARNEVKEERGMEPETHERKETPVLSRGKHKAHRVKELVYFLHSLSPDSGIVCKE